MAEPITLEEAAKRLVEIARHAEPAHAERQILCALKSVKIAAYRENLFAARFHNGSMGRGLGGLIEGIVRSLDVQESELRYA